MKGSTVLKKITAEAKKIYKSGKASTYKAAQKKAAAKIKKTKPAKRAKRSSKRSSKKSRTKKSRKSKK